jgi:DNA-binding MarR family transcriptional regulator
VRKPDLRDKRNRPAAITDEGRRRHDAAAKHVRPSLERHLGGALSASELRELKNALDMVIQTAHGEFR